MAGERVHWHIEDLSLWGSGLLWLGGLGVGRVVHDRRKSGVPLSDFVTQWSRNFEEKGDQFRNMCASKINRKNRSGRHGCGNTAGVSF